MHGRETLNLCGISIRGRRSQLQQVEPNPAHQALVTLEEYLGDNLLLVTQNVDDLHSRAGSKNLIHMHGELRILRCEDVMKHLT